jgi:hypothetical protein
MPSEKVKAFAKKSLREFWFNSWIMLVLQLYLDMLAPSTIQLLYYSQGPIFELVSGLIVFVRSRQACCVLLLPLSVVLLLYNAASILKAEEPSRQLQQAMPFVEEPKSFSVLFAEFKNDTGKITLMFYPVFMLRRIAYAAALLLLYKQPGLLYGVCVVLCLPVCPRQSFTFLLNNYPFKSEKLYALVLYIDGCIFLTFIVLGVFLLELEASAQYTYILLVKLIIGSIFLASLSLQLHSLYLKLKRLYNRVKHKTRVDLG